MLHTACGRLLSTWNATKNWQLAAPAQCLSVCREIIASCLIHGHPTCLFVWFFFAFISFLPSYRWVVFEEPGFCGEPHVLERGLYGCPEDWGALQPRVGSAMTVVLVRANDVDANMKSTFFFSFFFFPSESEKN